MATCNYADLIMFKLSCTATECGSSFEKSIRRLADWDTIPCPACGTIVDLKPYKGAIDDRIEIATELDKAPGQQQKKFTNSLASRSLEGLCPLLAKSRHSGASS